MVVRYSWLILLSAMLTIVAQPSAVSAAGCYRDKVVYTNEPATIRAAPNTSGAFVRDTMQGEALFITNIRRSNASCWLQTREGWLIYDPLVISDTFYGADIVATGAGRPCLEGEIAAITGPMNIRKSPTTTGPVVATAQAGATYTIIQKTVGVKWCWLQISLGWLADTERVRVTYPNRFLDTGSTAPTTAPSDVDNCCFVDRQCRTEQEWTDGYWARQNGQCGAPSQSSGANLSRPRIEGSEAFVNVINESLNIIERKAPTLYQYIVSVTRVIEERLEEPGTDDCNLGLAYVGTGRTSLGSCVKDLHLYNTDMHLPKPLYAYHAAYLAHEACHHHGDDMLTGVFDHEPCHRAGTDAVDAMSA